MTTHVEDGALVRYMDDECDAVERVEVEEHLDGCDTCGTRVAELRRHAATVSTALRALDRSLPGRRPARRWGMRAAVAALVVLGVAGSVQPVRAWIIGTTKALWATVMGTRDESPGPPSGVPVRSAVTFVPTGTDFTVEIGSWQRAGRLVVDGVPGDSATTVVIDGSGTEDLIVLPAGLRIANSEASSASYEVHLPDRLVRIQVRVGNAPPVTFDPKRGSMGMDLRHR
jgi:predicted anti-sigma-YlaC factor YlaD